MKAKENLRNQLKKIGATLDDTDYTLNCDSPSGYVWIANRESNYAIHYATNSQTWLTEALKNDMPALKMGLEKVTDPKEIERFRYDLDDDTWGASVDAPEKIEWPKCMNANTLEKGK